MDRRDFLKTNVIGLVGLFLPRWTRGAWKQKPSLALAPFDWNFPRPWDYELALCDQAGREILGRGYGRVRGVLADFGYGSSRSEWFDTESKRALAFAPAGECWYKVDSVKMLNAKGEPLWQARFPAGPTDIATGVVVQFNPGDIQIHGGNGRIPLQSMRGPPLQSMYEPVTMVSRDVICD